MNKCWCVLISGRDSCPSDTVPGRNVAQQGRWARHDTCLTDNWQPPTRGDEQVTSKAGKSHFIIISLNVDLKFATMFFAAAGVLPQNERRKENQGQGGVRRSQAEDLPCDIPANSSGTPRLPCEWRLHGDPGEPAARLRFILSHFLSQLFLCFTSKSDGGEPQLFWPGLAIVVNDNPEGQRLAGIYDSMEAKHPCRMCRCLLLSDFLW